MSEVVTHGLRQYVQRSVVSVPPVASVASVSSVSSVSLARRPVLPERVAARLRELRSSGRSELLSATLAELNKAGWPLRPLADALDISPQAVQARVRRWISGQLREHVDGCEPPPPFPHRRMASAAGLRPHLTIRIDQALRVAAHRAAAHDGRSLSQVVEAILDRYLRHGLTDGDQPLAARPSSRARPARRSR